MTATVPGEPDDVVDQDAVRTRLVAAVEGLLERDERWHPLPSPGGSTLTRVWGDETADMLLILSPDTAYAWREDPRGREVTRLRGTAEQVIASVREWQAPSEPDAPDGTGHIPGPSGM